MAKITIVGDLLCYPSITEACGKNYSSLLKNIEKLKECDYLIGNLETPVAGEGLKFTYERYRFNTPTEYVIALKKFGFNLFTLANNHALDRGEEGLIATIDNCKKIGIETIGAYKSKEERSSVFIKEIDGIKVAFINYTYGVNSFAHLCFLDHKYMVNLTQPEETLKGSIHLLESNDFIGNRVDEIYCRKNDEFKIVMPYLNQLESDIKTAKQKADYVIMLLHCGGQYNEEVDPYSAMLTQKIKEYGADMIIANHPHIIQPCKIENDYLTVFSFGNFIDDTRLKTDSPIDHRYNAVLYLDLHRNNDKSIKANVDFGLYYIDDSSTLPVPRDTFDMYKENPSAEFKFEILSFAGLFAGENRYSEVKESYRLL